MEYYVPLFQKTLQQLGHYDEAVVKALIAIGHMRRIRQQSILPARSYDAFFLGKGTLSLQQDSSSKIIHFISSSQIVLDSKVEAGHHYQALEDCILFTLPLHSLEQVHRQHPNLYQLEKELDATWSYQINHRQRILDLDKKDRKSAFKQYFPTIVGTIPQALIANYLSISREYFSKTNW